MTKLGASGSYPQDKLNRNDEGELTFAISPGQRLGNVRLEFGKPVEWFEMNWETAIDLANELLHQAAMAKKAEEK